MTTNANRPNVRTLIANIDDARADALMVGAADLHVHSPTMRPACWYVIPRPGLSDFPFLMMRNQLSDTQAAFPNKKD
jgi:hypothetical protein